MSVEPFVLHRTKVSPEWIDYNGHVNFVYYMLAFDDACDRLMDYFGLGESYKAANNRTMYMLEAHVTYAREVMLGDPLAIETQLIGFDRKRIHFFQRMCHADQGYPTATAEFMVLHVDVAGPRAVEMPAESLAIMERLLEEHRKLPRPPELGRHISLERRSA